MSDETRIDDDELDGDDAPAMGDGDEQGTDDAQSGGEVGALGGGDAPDDASEPAADDGTETEPLGSAYVDPAEAVATAFPQHWNMMFCCVAIFVACIWLPIEGGLNNLYASHSIAGGFLTVFAAYGMYSQHANIKYRRMIVWPALFMAMDGLYVTVSRIIRAVSDWPDTIANNEIPRHLGGPGTWVILFCSLLVFWTLVRGAMQGAKKEGERKEAARVARKAR